MGHYGLQIINQKCSKLAHLGRKVIDETPRWPPAHMWKIIFLPITLLLCHIETWFLWQDICFVGQWMKTMEYKWMVEYIVWMMKCVLTAINIIWSPRLNTQFNAFLWWVYNGMSMTLHCYIYNVLLLFVGHYGLHLHLGGTFIDENQRWPPAHMRK